MTNIIEGEMTTDSEHMTKFLLNMGMEWLESIEFNETDTHPPMQKTTGVFLDNSNEVRRLMESVGIKDKQITQVLKCICKWVTCSRVTMYFRKYNETQTLYIISPSWRMSACFCFYEFKEGNKHSLYLIKRWVQTHMFYEPEKGGVCSQKRVFKCLV